MTRGDYNTAMKQVNLAIHYDPLSRDAIVLRNEIVAAGGFEDESIHEYLHRGLAPVPGGSRDYSSGAIPGRNSKASARRSTRSPTIPGEPGPSADARRISSRAAGDSLA